MGDVTRAYLGIDSATRYLALALWDEERGLLAEYAEDVGREHAARVVPELQRLLDRARLTPADVAGIGVGIGPGSYTGVRVGVATARGLARAWGVPLGGASTLAGIALRALRAGEAGVAVIDARRGNVYAAAFERPGDPTVPRPLPRGAPEKVGRGDLQARFGALRVLEGVPPDACHAAFEAREPAAPEPLYL